MNPNLFTSPAYPHSGSFFWFHGIVEDIMDPKKMGRVKIRAIGFHNDDKALLPTADLPWAIPVTPITSASLKGVGTSATGVKVGSWVLGFFRDGASAQEPVVLGTFQSSTDDVNDIPKAAETNYPLRSVIRTESGHEIIIDDTNGKDIIHITHKNGATVQMNSNKDINIKTGGNINITASKNVNIKGKRINLN